MKMLRCSILLLTILIGCATMSFAPAMGADQLVPNRDPLSVEVFFTKRPTRDYIEAGFIKGSFDEEEGHITSAMKLRAYAAKLGCHAVIYMGMGTETTAVWGGIPSSNNAVTAACIIYK